MIQNDLNISFREFVSFDPYTPFRSRVSACCPDRAAYPLSSAAPEDHDDDGYDDDDDDHGSVVSQNTPKTTETWGWNNAQSNDNKRYEKENSAKERERGRGKNCKRSQTNIIKRTLYNYKYFICHNSFRDPSVLAVVARRIAFPASFVPASAGQRGRTRGAKCARDLSRFSREFWTLEDFTIPPCPAIARHPVPHR